MNFLFSNDFKKKLKKTPQKITEAFLNRLRIFASDNKAVELNIHKLKGKYEGYQSINVTGDYRAVYTLLDSKIAYFIDIDNHSNLYK